MTRTAADPKEAVHKSQERSLRTVDQSGSLHGHRWHPKPPLGAILISIGVLTDAQLNLALARQRKLTTREPLGRLLVEMGVVKRTALEHALSIQQSVNLRSSRTPSQL